MLATRQTVLPYRGHRSAVPLPLESHGQIWWTVSGQSCSSSPGEDSHASSSPTWLHQPRYVCWPQSDNQGNIKGEEWRAQEYWFFSILAGITSDDFLMANWTQQVTFGQLVRLIYHIWWLSNGWLSTTGYFQPASAADKVPVNLQRLISSALIFVGQLLCSVWAKWYWVTVSKKTDD